MTQDVYSRQRLAGYDPDRLHERRVLIAGAGSLAQPVGDTLVLSGVGDTRIVDLDRFEAHNRAKSSLYPHHLRDTAAGPLPYKAEWVATALAERATAPGGVVRYANAWVQRLGAAAVRDVDVVVSCVDAISARSWLARTALEQNRPLVTGGFSANQLWYAVYPAAGAAHERPCWNCSGTPEADDVFSCRHYAEAAAKAGIVPAIQSGATALAGFMAEATIMLLHDRETAPRFVALDLRTGETTVSKLLPDPDCARRHRITGADAVIDTHPATATLADIAAGLDDSVILAVLPAPLVRSAACRMCARTTAVDAPLWEWEAAPRCDHHGGPWRRTIDEVLGVPPVTVSEVRPRDPLWNVPMAELGIAPGDSLAVRTHAGSRTVQVDGSSDEQWTVAETGSIDVTC